MAKLADAQDLGSCAERRIGSRPIGGTASRRGALGGQLTKVNRHAFNARRSRAVETALGQEMARYMCHFQARKWQKAPPRRGKAVWSAARFVCRMTLYACRSSSHKTRYAIFVGTLKDKKALSRPLHRGGYIEEGLAITPSVCFADTSLLYRAPAKILRSKRFAGRGDASRAGKPRRTQRRTCGLCGDEATRRQGAPSAARPLLRARGVK